jgi:hypothetical protein
MSAAGAQAPRARLGLFCNIIIEKRGRARYTVGKKGGADVNKDFDFLRGTHLT